MTFNEDLKYPLRFPDVCDAISSRKELLNPLDLTLLVKLLYKFKIDALVNVDNEIIYNHYDPICYLVQNKEYEAQQQCTDAGLRNRMAKSDHV